MVSRASGSELLASSARHRPSGFARRSHDSARRPPPSELRWRSFADALPQLVWVASPDGHIEYLSARAGAYTGLTEAAALADGWASAVDPDDAEKTRSAWRHAVEGELPHEVEHRIRRADGEYRWFTSRAEPARDAGGRVVKWIGSSTDITSLKMFEAALERSTRAAEAANRAKDELMANVSHDIRTPMNAILGMAGLAHDFATTDEQRRALATVKSAARNLLGIVDDLLEFSKMAAGKLSLDRAELSLRDQVGDVLRALAARRVAGPKRVATKRRGNRRGDI
jgi:PAS domain S-box-containing protein